jgi:MFS transporter, DHA1 family, solute carrier family 18 (vesicular amine transporter), member 1/2
MAWLRALRGSPPAALAVVTLAIFTDMLLYGLIVPILPGYAASMGVSELAIGVLFGSYSLALLVATPFFGALTDRVGRRGPMLGGVIGIGAATLLFAVAATYPALVGARLLQGVAAAATWIAGLALVADLFPAQSRGRAMGIALSGMTGGVLVGPPLGGFLYEWGGYAAPFLVAAAVALVDGVAIALLLVDPPRAASERVSLPELLGDRAILVPSGTAVVAASTWGLLEPTLPLHLESVFGVSPTVVGLVFGLATLAYGVATPLIGTLSDRWGRRPTTIVGIVGLAGAMPLVGLAPTLLLVVAGVLVVSVAYGCALIPALPALAEAVDRRGGGAYGAAYALYNAAYAVGMMAGPVLGGALAEWFGFPVAMAVTGLAMLAYLPVLLRVRTPSGAPPAATREP